MIFFNEMKPNIYGHIQIYILRVQLSWVVVTIK